MSKSPAFQFYVQDFLLGTIHMNAEQVGGYILLLCRQWDKGGIENKEAQLLKISRVKKKNLDEILKKFELRADGLLYNERLEKVRLGQQDYLERQRKNGEKGGRPKKPNETHEKPTGYSGFEKTEPKKTSSSSTSSSTSTSSSEYLFVCDNMRVTDFENFMSENFAIAQNAWRKQYGSERYLVLVRDFKQHHNQGFWKTLNDFRHHFSNFLASKNQILEKEKNSAKKENYGSNKNNRQQASESLNDLARAIRGEIQSPGENLSGSGPISHSEPGAD